MKIIHISDLAMAQSDISISFYSNSIYRHMYINLTLMKDKDFKEDKVIAARSVKSDHVESDHKR